MFVVFEDAVSVSVRLLVDEGMCLALSCFPKAVPQKQLFQNRLAP